MSHLNTVGMTSLGACAPTTRRAISSSHRPAKKSGLSHPELPGGLRLARIGRGLALTESAGHRHCEPEAKGGAIQSNAAGFESPRPDRGSSLNDLPRDLE